ncbi:hypothetical protein [Viridibacillus arvi]|uniref:Uncharacterized protein n=1 Tax=Viridibacillus arvi TaxID=263475 RepID=A0A0M0LLA3_9BACL|nr:hypothetical protein [Viridibacillus arvi]KOO51860.1 hypothetical protein AMD00_05345 [Viridibacillus arvi]
MKANNIQNWKASTIVLLSLLISAILIGCENNNDLQQTQSTKTEVEMDTNKEQDNISEYTSELESLQMQTEYMNMQNQYLVSVIKQMMKNFSNEEMLEFSKKQFVYELQVNGESIPRNERLAIPQGDVEILLLEKGMGYDFLPPKWLEKGRLSGDYIDHILNFDTTNWTPLGTDGTVATAQGYKTTNMKAGERVSLNITDDLKEKLDLVTNKIQIDVN